MNKLSDIFAYSASPITNKSHFSLYSGTTSNQSQKHNQQYANHIYITNLYELIDVAESYSHTPHSFKTGKRLKTNWQKTNCLILDIDNSHSENEETWLDTNSVSQLIGAPHYIIPSKSHMRWKTNIDGSIRKNEGDSPRPRLHIYIPTEQDIEDADLFEYLSDTIKNQFTFDNVCLLDTSVSGRSGSFFSSNSIDREFCSYNARNTNFFDWIEQISYQSLEEFKTKRTPKKVSKKGQRKITVLDPSIDNRDLQFLGENGYLVKQFSNDNGTWQVQHLGEKSSGGYFYSPENKRIWKHDCSSSNKNWSIYDFLKEFSPNHIPNYLEFIGCDEVSDQRDIENEFSPYETVKEEIEDLIEYDYFSEGNDVFLTSTQGSGKSDLVAKKIKDHIEKTGENVGVYLPTNKLGDTWVEEKLRKYGLSDDQIVRISGREYKENCSNPNIGLLSRELSKRGSSTTKEVCKKCPEFSSCKYFSQFKKYNGLSKGKVFVMPRNYLTTEFPNIVDKPNLHKIVIDELPIDFISDNKEEITFNDLSKVFQKYRDYNDPVSDLFDTFLEILETSNSDNEFRELVSLLNDEQLLKFDELFKSIWIKERSLKIKDRFPIFNTEKLFNEIIKLIENNAYRGVLYCGNKFTLISKKNLLNPYQNLPMLVLDADGRDEKLNTLSDAMNKRFNLHNFNIKPKLNLYQINKSYSDYTLSQPNFSFHNEIGNLVNELQTQNKKVLFFIRVDKQEILKRYLDTTGLDYKITHAGAARGIDTYKDMDVCVYIGWFLQPPSTVIEKYTALYPNEPLELDYKVNGDYDVKKVFVKTLDGTETIVEQKCFIHPNKIIENRLNELLKQTLIDEMNQSIARLRFVHCDEPKQVYILNSQLASFPITNISNRKSFRSGNTTQLDNRLKNLIDRTDFDNDCLILDYKVVGSSFVSKGSFKMWKNQFFGVKKHYIYSLIRKIYPKLNLYSYSYGRGTNQYFVLSEKTYDETKLHLETYYLSVLGVKTIRDGIEPIIGSSTPLNTSLPEKITDYDEVRERRRQLIINTETNLFPLLPFEIEDEIYVGSFIDTTHTKKPPSTYGFI